MRLSKTPGHVHMNIGVRWALVAPAALSGWYLTLLLGLILHGVLEKFCPSDQVVSNACIAPWFSTATDILMILCAGLAATLVVTFGTWAAPSHRTTVAWALFGVGSVMALSMGWALSAHAECIAAILCGLATTLVIRTGLRIPTPSYDTENGCGP